MEQSQPSSLDSAFSHRRSKTSSFIRQQNELFQFLESEIGLTQQQAKLIINAHNCQNKAQIVNLFIKDQITHTYSHLYCPNQFNVCIICEQQISSHTYVSNLVFKNVINKINNDTIYQQFLDEEKQQQQKCNICYGYFSPIEIVNFNGQNHSICIDCFKSYLTQQINIARVTEMRCPHCSIQLKATFIEQIVDKQTFKKYKIFLRNNLIQNDPQLRWCPNAKCGKIIKIKNKKNKTEKCECGIQICVKCNREAHEDKSCDQVFKNQIKEWSDAIDLQKCKKCKSLVEKVSGCNHMTCGICKYQWCWLCSATYSPIHFSPLNPFGCPGLQNGDNLSRNWGCFKRSLYRIGVFLLILILIPIVIPISLLAAGPVFFIIKLRQTNYYYYSGKCVKLLLAILVTILGILMDPIIWIGLIAYYLPQGISGLIRIGQHRRQIQNISRTNIRQRLISQQLIQ